MYLIVRDTGTTPVYVTSHVDFASVNRTLEFDRDLAQGMRLDVAAGDSIGWMSEQARQVRLATATLQATAADTIQGTTS